MFPDHGILLVPSTPLYFNRYRAWESKSGEIYTKSFDSKTTFGGVLNIMRHACSITKASDLRVYRDLKRKTVHFIINGEELKVACGSNRPDLCYGYLRMGCKNAESRIRVTLVPGIEGILFISEKLRSVLIDRAPCAFSLLLYFLLE